MGLDQTPSDECAQDAFADIGLYLRVCGIIQSKVVGLAQRNPTSSVAVCRANADPVQTLKFAAAPKIVA